MAPERQRIVEIGGGVADTCERKRRTAVPFGDHNGCSKTTTIEAECPTIPQIFQGRLLWPGDVPDRFGHCSVPKTAKQSPELHVTDVGSLRLCVGDKVADNWPSKLHDALSVRS